MGKTTVLPPAAAPTEPVRTLCARQEIRRGHAEQRSRDCAGELEATNAKLVRKGEREACATESRVASGARAAKPTPHSYISSTGLNTTYAGCLEGGAARGRVYRPALRRLCDPR